jgi:hypothetical protein
VKSDHFLTVLTGSVYLSLAYIDRLFRLTCSVLPSIFTPSALLSSPNAAPSQVCPIYSSSGGHECFVCLFPLILLKATPLRDPPVV